MNPILINGEAYSWAQVVILIGTNLFYGITKIDYKAAQDKKNNMGIGIYPVSRGRGGIEYGASITIHRDDVKRMIAASPGGSLASLPPFSIKVLYGDASNPTKDELLNVEFMEDGNTAAQGDTVFAKDLPLIYAGLKQ